ncbi:Uncharacterised protein [Salmonella enterica subsp. arizonae]|uniref:Uncharacterized protein n=1 Tax=Salmonella enterica subsp. arizonae TaxID=59203 RepID=A0A379TDJ7_SALER|nr:Uncharacterised protein [Salmonella enterica subsp. arizonae]
MTMQPHNVPGECRFTISTRRRRMYGQLRYYAMTTTLTALDSMRW